MIDRRTFLQSGIALPAVSMASALVFPASAATAAAGTLELERFVYDARFAEAFDIAEHIRALGIELSAVADNLMELWYDDLDLRWKEAPMALAGVTMAEALFVLETLAMDRRMRVVYRGKHAPVENGVIRHKLAGPSAIVDRLASLPADAAWEAELSRAMAACPLGEIEPAEAELVTNAPGLAVRDEPIYSWIIAPRSAVALTIPS